MIRRSIRWRVQLWHGLILAVILTALLVTFYRHEKGLKYAELNRQAREVMTEVMPVIAPPGPKRGRGGPEGVGELEGRDRPDMRRGEDLETRLDELIPETGWLYVFDREGGLIYPMAVSGVLDLDGYFSEETEQFYVSDAVDIAVLERNMRRGERILVGVPTEEVDVELVALRNRLLVIGVLVLGVAFVVGWFLTGNALKPIRVISSTAKEISGGDWDRRIVVSEADGELGELAGVLNETFSELQRSYDRQVRFTADASHEIRTPLSVILAKCQYALRGDRDGEVYRNALLSCEEAAQHMRGLVADLLSISKMDSGNLNLEMERRGLCGFLEECCEMVSELAREQGSKVEGRFEAVELEFDAREMRQVMLNLLSNALKYGGKLIEVESKVVGEFVEVRVRDDGDGIAAGDVEHLFERFYRADKSRTVNRGASMGLGLTISKGIVEAHGGSIAVESVEGKETVMIVRLPLN